MTLRRAGSNDLPSIHALEATCFSDPWSEDALRRAFGDTITEFVVIEDDGDVFGYAMFSVVLEDAEIMSVAVAPDRRGCGAGRALMHTVLESASERGATQCFLEVRASNTPARALYASLGFTEVRTIRSYYRRPTEDAIVMLRVLP